MKKTIAIALACFILLGLAACGTSSDTGSKVPETNTSADAPKTEGVQEKTDEDGSGDLLVGYIIPSTDIEILTSIGDYLQEHLAEKDVDFQVSGAMFDNSQYISLIENYITMGADIILAIPMDTDAIKDAALAAEAAGVNILYIGSVPSYGDDISGGVYSDYYEAGFQAGKMACAWAKENYPDLDSIPIALTVAESDKDSITRTSGMRDAIEEDEKCYVAYEHFNATTADNGYTFAEEALTFDSSIRVFLNYESDPAIGVDNYIQAYVQSDASMSIEDFGVFAVGYSSTVVSLVEASAEGGSAVRGIISYSALIPGEPILEVIEQVIAGETPYWLAEECFSVNSFGYNY